MRTRIAIQVLLLIVIAGGAGWWYHVTQSACRIPIEYSIGDIDPRFDLSTDEVRAAVSDAESLWEDATGKNLFTYTPDAAFTINFVFDERQETTYEEQSFREKLDEKENVSEAVRQQYEDLVAKYKALKASYDTQSAAYEEELSAHNEEVERWNSEGGAPPDVYEQLNVRQSELAKQRTTLNNIAYQLNQLVRQINAIGEQGNEAVQEYNQGVSWYNSHFDTDREFTQGEYQGDRINIYQFDSSGELRRVLAHELGHALGLEHVDDENAVMYYLMEGQKAGSGLTAADLTEFARVCGSD